MMSAARWAAFETLRAVNAGARDLPAALVAARARLDDPRDQALAAEIATGVLRWRAALDHLVAHFAGRPLARLDPPIVDVLRVGAYQLLHLDRVPASAAINDAVDMAKRAGKRSAAGLVNAVLRAIDRARGALPLPPDPGPDGPRAAQLDYLAVTLSHPRWLVERWLDREGFANAAAHATFDNTPARLTLRVNTLATSPLDLTRELAAHGVEVEPARFAPFGLVVRRGNPLATPVAGTGRFVVQDEASQLVAAMVGARAGERVLDACASPGGKTTAMAAAMRDEGLVVAVDVRPRRIGLLRRGVAASGARAVRVVRADVTRALPFAARFDRALLDAPCSGLGTLRRDPEIRWRRTPADLVRLAGAQLAMLDQVAAALLPGGRLVYATCSSEPEENDEVVERFLSTHPAFTEAGPDTAESDRPVGLAAVVEPSGRLRTSPARHGLESFFAAMLVKRKHL